MVFEQLNSHIRDKVLPYLTCGIMLLKKKKKGASGVDTSNLAVKRDFIALKAEIDKLDITKLVNIPTALNNLKTKIDDLDFHKLKTFL